jgi:hypothetical protein
VARRFGITLEYEIEFVGDWSGWPWADAAAAGETPA